MVWGKLWKVHSFPYSHRVSSPWALCPCECDSQRHQRRCPQLQAPHRSAPRIGAWAPAARAAHPHPRAPAPPCLALLVLVALAIPWHLLPRRPVHLRPSELPESENPWGSLGAVPGSSRRCSRGGVSSDTFVGWSSDSRVAGEVVEARHRRNAAHRVRARGDSSSGPEKGSDGPRAG